MRDNLLVTDEVAEEIRRAPATLRYWRHIGEGPPSFKIGRRVMYRRDELLAWIEAQAAADPHHTAGIGEAS